MLSLSLSGWITIREPRLLLSSYSCIDVSRIPYASMRPCSNLLTYYVSLTTVVIVLSLNLSLSYLFSLYLSTKNWFGYTT